jgi:succinoglycan biosynthesis transport protein ExoP
LNLHQLFLILRARYRLIALVLLATVIAAVAVAMVLPPRYKASTSLVIDFKSMDPITGTFMPVQLLLSSYMATELDILESQAVALKVVQALKLAEEPGNRTRFLNATGGQGPIEEWLAGGLRSQLEVKPSKESRIIEVNFTSPDPQFSARAANAFAQAYIQTNLEMKVAPARESATWFDGQQEQLRKQLEEAQGRLTRFQSEKGITSSDQRMDVEMAKLAEISSQLVQIQAQAYENASRQKQLQEFIARDLGVDSLPEVLSSPVIQELKSRLSAAESRLSQASNTLGVNHPEYQRAQSEVSSLRKKLRDEVGTASSVIGNNLRITQSRERELRDAVAQQKSRLLDINRHRDELGVMMREVDNAQRAYDSASQRHTQTTLESRMDKGNVSVLNIAIPPIKPSFPNLIVIGVLALVVGLVLGMGFALAVELMDRRVRGVEDLVQAVGVQVWGVLANTAALAKDIERRKRSFLKKPRILTSMQEPKLE